ncbi:hypothetical protein D3C85_835400 [compost metagenome]
MGIYIKVTDRAMVDAISSKRGPINSVSPKTLLALCPIAHSIHFHAGEPDGLLIDMQLQAESCALTHSEKFAGLRLVDNHVVRFGKSYGLFEPNRRTNIGRELADQLDALKHASAVSGYALDLVGPRIRSKLSIDEFGFDYRSNARVHFISGAIYIGLIGVSVERQAYDTGSGVELICRDEYRTAVKSAQVHCHELMFAENDTLVIRAQQALDPFLPLPVKTINQLMTDIYQRVITEPKDVGYYINHMLLDRELVYIYTSLVAILHAFYGIEA